MQLRPKHEIVASGPGQLIVGTGEVAQLIREFDWTSAGLGPIESWNLTLLSTINLLLQSPVPIVTLWGDDGILIYNDAYSEFAGTRHPDILGAKVVEGWPEIADFNRQVMKKVYYDGESYSLKDQELLLYRNNSAEPDRLWTDLTYSPIIDIDGTRVGVFVIVIETTDTVHAQKGQKKAERALRLEQKRLENLFMQAPAMIAVLSGPDHIFELANPLYIKTVAPNRKIVGKPLIKALPELAGQGIIEILDEVLQTGVTYKGELSVKLDRYDTGVLEDGYFNLVYQPISSKPDGKPDSIFVHAVEITDQVLSRRKAESLNAELEAIFESLPDGVITTDLKQIKHINQRGALNLGFESVADVPRDLHEFYSKLLVQYSQEDHSPKSIDLANTSIGRALRGEIIDNGEVKVQNVNTGVKRIVHSAAAPIRDNDGTIIGSVATTTDMTGQYDLREKMQREIVRRKVLSQKTKLLKEQNDQLTLLNQTKDEFIALTSHQLRTPATGVKQYIGMITQGFAGDVTPQQRDFLDRAYESNDRQLQIIDDILRVARIDLDEIKLQKTKIDVAALIEGLVAEQSDTFASRGQTIVMDIKDKPIEARVDERNLGMAIGNIIDNASKYTENGKTITITVSKQGKTVVISVKDEGVGIAPADISRLFQKFSRIHNDRSIQVGGTGLGLYLSHKLVEKHDGSISVDSKANVGTTFTVTLPL